MHETFDVSPDKGLNSTSKLLTSVKRYNNPSSIAIRNIKIIGDGVTTLLVLQFTFLLPIFVTMNCLIKSNLPRFSRQLSTSTFTTTVAVTGSSGYIGSFVVAELLSRGYKVNVPIRGSIENPKKADHLKALPGAENLAIFDGGDLSKQGSFDAAFADADAVIHTAAQVDLGEDESIITDSVEGTKNVLSSVDKSSGVKRFVQTSSVAAIQKYDVPSDYVFTERDWNDWSAVEKGDAYGVAKTTAEKVRQSEGS